MPGALFPPRALQTMRTLWFALTFSTVLLLVVLNYAQRPSTPPPPMFLPMFAAISLAVFVVGIVFPRQQLVALIRKRGGVPAPFYITPFILGMALTESVALFGFILGFFNFAPTMYMPFFALAWIGFVLRFPRPTHPIGYLGPEYVAPPPPVEPGAM